ncbi:MAG: hypothetical protein ACI837_001119 [Crocinitomicaceae bacterium]|jgi:hypothetical protein
MSEKSMKYKMKCITLIIFSVILLLACKKDKVPVIQPVEPTKWELIEGEYKVYDTLGTFLYNMNIVHIYNELDDLDSLRFENFDGEFTFTALQTSFSNDPETLIRIGYHDLLFDSILNRWKLLYAVDEIYNNVLYNDTIKMNFGKTNINYWILDGVPYFACDCKQIAVKQF